MTDAPTERDANGALAKLRRRKVVQWGLAYAAGAWALLQRIGLSDEQVAALDFDIEIPLAAESHSSGSVEAH